MAGEKAIRKIKGKVLEIGVGTGKNLQYYNYKNVDLTGIDVSEGMLSKARLKAKNLNSTVNLMQMDAQKLRFKDNCFDVVIGTFVLCSIPDPVKALKEIKRVVKPGGKIIFVEHVLSKYKLIALWEHIHNPITTRLFGFNVNRDTRNNIKKAGITILNDENIAFFDVFRIFTCLG